MYKTHPAVFKTCEVFTIVTSTIEQHTNILLIFRFYIRGFFKLEDTMDSPGRRRYQDCIFVLKCFCN